jgi:hypothetical protein
MFSSLLCAVLLCYTPRHNVLPTQIIMIFNGYEKLNRVEEKEPIAASNVNYSLMGVS